MLELQHLLNPPGNPSGALANAGWFGSLSNLHCMPGSSRESRGYGGGQGS